MRFVIAKIGRFLKKILAANRAYSEIRFGLRVVNISLPLSPLFPRSYFFPDSRFKGTSKIRVPFAPPPNTSRTAKSCKNRGILPHKEELMGPQGYARNLYLFIYFYSEGKDNRPPDPVVKMRDERCCLIIKPRSEISTLGLLMSCRGPTPLL